MKLFGAGVVAAAVLLSVQIHWSNGATQQAAKPDARPECPHDELIVKLYDKRGTFVGLGNSVPLSDPITDIPEFHDCQRFIPNKVEIGQWVFGGQSEPMFFDSLFAIFAAFRLNDLPNPLEGNGTPVATIYSFGGSYPPLGIHPGFNCLVLSGSAAEWTAKMLPQDQPNDPDCRASHINVLASGTPLKVRMAPRLKTDSGGTFAAANYPPVARWDWDGEYQYIGIACPTGWCEIGPEGFSPSPLYAGPTIVFDPIPGLAVSAQQREQVTRIKGWYDDQLLDTLANGRHVITGVRGWLFPNPDLEDADLDNPSSVQALSGIWVHVASASVTGKYKGNLTRGVNRIYMCHESVGTPRRCKLPSAQTAAAVGSDAVDVTQSAIKPFSKPLTACDPEPDGTRRYWKIVSATGKVRSVCVKRRDHFQALNHYRQEHPNVQVWIPATARWRWMLTDVGEWHKCETGCCTGQ